MEQISGVVIYNKPVNGAGDFFRMELHAPEIAAQALSGQFLMVAPTDGQDPFLKRPMAICHMQRNEGRVGILYQVIGKGTAILSQAQSGETLEVLGPLGNAWYMPPADTKKILLIGGGAGLAPMLPLATALAERGLSIDVFIGWHDASHLPSLEDLPPLAKVRITTEDGSLGEKGRVDMLLKEASGYDMAYACGPEPLMKKTAVWAKENGTPCQVSLEARMGCGFGICMGCVCDHEDEEGHISYKRVCREGPVFWAEEVFFNG